MPNHNEDLYYLLRDMFNHKIPLKYLDSVIYFFINKTAYSGMIRYNAQGDYNVPFGRYQNFNTQLITEAHHNLLQGTKLLTGDFSVPFSMATESDFMFLDPPYDCIFNDYGNIIFENGFDVPGYNEVCVAVYTDTHYLTFQEYYNDGSFSTRFNAEGVYSAYYYGAPKVYEMVN